MAQQIVDGDVGLGIAALEYGEDISQFVSKASWPSSASMPTIEAVKAFVMEHISQDVFSPGAMRRSTSWKP